MRPDPESPPRPADSEITAETEAPELPPEDDEQLWIRPPFQPFKAILALGLTASGFALYECVLLHFWSSEYLGIHERIPWHAWLPIAAAVFVVLLGVRVALGLWSPHARLGFSMLAFGACAAVGIGGGRFISYTLRGTLNPPFHLNASVGSAFPNFSLPDQNGTIHAGPISQGSKATLIYVYRGDFCPFARHEIADLNAIRPELKKLGVDTIAISADPTDRSKMLSAYLHSSLPLLSDDHETLLGPLGLVQRHRNREPDNAIPAFFIVDSTGVIRWIYTSPYYRQLPSRQELISAAQSITQ